MFPALTKSTIIALGLLLALTSCGTPMATPDDPRDPRLLTAVVERATIETVLVLEGVVVSHAPFTITSPADGRFERESHGSYILTFDDNLIRLPDLPGLTISVEQVVAKEGPVPQGLPLIHARHEGFAIVAEIVAAQILRIDGAPLGARAQISGGAGPFDCQLLDPFPGSVDGLAYAYSCAIPREQRVLAGMAGRLAVTLGRQEGVLALPVEAVAGSVDDGQVRVKTSDGFETRKVTLGASDGIRIEIVDGLLEGDEVYLPSPGLFDENR